MTAAAQDPVPRPHRARAKDQVAASDPVLEARARMARLARAGKRLGYGLFTLAVVLFAVGATSRFTPAIVDGVVTSLAVGSVALIPAIIIGYGVRAADREDRNR